MTPLKNIAVRGMRFGKGTVTDPEVRVTERPDTRTGRPYQRRYARLRCDCGNVYMASLTNLFSGRTKACTDCARSHPARRPGGRVKPSGRGFTVELYVGYFPTRRAAEEVAARSRAVMLPVVPPRAL